MTIAATKIKKSSEFYVYDLKSETDDMREKIKVGYSLWINRIFHEFLFFFFLSSKYSVLKCFLSVYIFLNHECSAQRLNLLWWKIIFSYIQHNFSSFWIKKVTKIVKIHNNRNSEWVSLNSTILIKSSSKFS